MSAPVSHVSRPVEHHEPARTPPPAHSEPSHAAAESKPPEHVGKKVDVKA